MLTSLVIAVVGALVGTILGVVLDLRNRLQRCTALNLHSLVKVLPFAAGPFKGLWLVEYQYEEDGDQFRERRLYEFQQFGTVVRAETVDNKGHGSLTVLKVHKPFLTGTWKHTDPGDDSHGAVHLYKIPAKPALKGKWLGFKKDKPDEIRSGEWSAERKVPDLSRSARARQLGLLEDQLGPSRIGDSV